MAAKNQMNGMRGVYLAAAELTGRGFIVSPTSRSAQGADLLVTDRRCQKAWAVQVKTNGRVKKSWLLNKDAKELRSKNYVYIFVNLRGDERPDFRVVPSRKVAEGMKQITRKTGSTWYWFCPPNPKSHDPEKEGWNFFRNSD